MKTAEEILNKHLDSDRTKESILKCMEEYRQQSYASQPMSAEQVEDKSEIIIEQLKADLKRVKLQRNEYELEVRNLYRRITHLSSELKQQFTAPTVKPDVDLPILLAKFSDYFASVQIKYSGNNFKGNIEIAREFLSQQQPYVKPDGWVSVEECKKREQDAYNDGYNTGLSHGKPIGY